MAANGSSSWSDALKAERRLQGNELAAEAPIRKLSVPLDVPIDAEHLSFGCYSKNSDFRVSKVRFEVINRTALQTEAAGIKDATDEIPYNVMVVPGYTIRKSPIGLDFEQSDSKPVEVATRPSDTDSR